MSQRRNLAVALPVLGLALLMVGAAFAAVPLYFAFCRATGYGGTTQVAQHTVGARGQRTLKVHFVANVAPGLDWSVEPEIDAVEARTGERPDIDALPLDDQDVFAMLSRGDSIGVFRVLLIPTCTALGPGPRDDAPCPPPSVS